MQSGGDKLTGWKEEFEGKILHNQQKAQHGKDMRTGELKKKEQEDEKVSNGYPPLSRHTSTSPHIPNLG